MLIVTGHPRSGTSLVMQTLQNLGYYVVGVPFPVGRDKSWQPDGKPFWEDPDALAGELEHLRNSDVAVKVILQKAVERVQLLEGDKIIFCNRNTDILAEKHLGLKIGSSTEGRIKKWCDRYVSKFDGWVGGHEKVSFDLDKVRKDRVKFVEDVRVFSGLEKDTIKQNKAIENVIEVT